MAEKGKSERESHKSFRSISIYMSFTPLDDSLTLFSFFAFTQTHFYVFNDGY